MSTPRIHARAWGSCAWAVLAAIATHAACSHAADGFFAASWAWSGREQVVVNSGEHRLGLMHVEPDGRILLAGNCGLGTLCAARVLSDGTSDPAFGAQATGTNVFDGLPTVTLTSVAPRSGGGYFLVGQMGARVFAACVAQNGLTETSCNGGSGYFVFDFRPDVAKPYSEAISSALAPDGTLIVAGAADVHRNGVFNLDAAVARLKADLSGLVTDFGTAGVATLAYDLDGEFGGGYANGDRAIAVAAMADASIAIAGVAQDAGNDRRIVGHLQANGAPDPGFGIAGRSVFLGPAGSAGAFFAVAPDRRGGLVAAGYYQVGSVRFDVAHIGANGLSDWETDIPFGDAGYANAVTVQPDGDVLAAGRVTMSSVNYFGVVRVRHDDGSVDPTFGSSGKSYGYFTPPTQVGGYDENGWGIAVANGGIILSGSSRTPAGQHVFGIAKLQLDSVFRDGFE